MAHYRQYANESDIKNLTSITYRVYASTGGFVILEPSVYSKDDPETTKYICSTASKDWFVEHGIDLDRLFFASCSGTGRDNKLIWRLHPYNVERPRLVPHRES